MDDDGTSAPDRSGGVGSRVLVVGASSGIGREIALAVGVPGNKVALAARRVELIDGLAGLIGAGGGLARTWRCDVSKESDCHRVVDESVAWLGGIDMLVYMAGYSPLVRIEEATSQTWNDLLATNLVGAAVMVSRALDTLRGSDNPVVVVTTHSMGVPWPWLGVYGVTKAALAEFARALRVEEPGLRVVCVSVGATATSFADGWDPDVAAQAMESWAAQGLMSGGVKQPSEMAEAILLAVCDADGPDDLLISAGPDN